MVSGFVWMGGDGGRRAEGGGGGRGTSGPGARPANSRTRRPVRGGGVGVVDVIVSCGDWGRCGFGKVSC